MAVPWLFLSSTCYDLAEVRDSLTSFILSFGFEPCLSERGDVFYHPDLHTHESCIQEVSNCHLFVLLIGGRFGGTYVADTTKSIVNAEYAAARELNVPVFTFIRKDVLDDHRVYQKNRSNPAIGAIQFPSIENQKYAKHIFEFIDEVRLAKVNNGIFPFEYSKEIHELLRKQWAGMLFDFLRRRSLTEQYESQARLLSQLAATGTQLEELLKGVYRKLDQPHAEAAIADAQAKSQAEKFFRDLFRYYGVSGFRKLDLNKLAQITVKQEWFDFLAATGDFHISKNVTETDGSHRSDVVTSNYTNNCASFRGELRDTDIARADNFERGFAAFAKLSPEARREVLAQFIEGGNA